MNVLLSAWAGVVIVLGSAFVVTLVGVVWIIFFRKNVHRRRRRRLPSEQHQLNPTLAQIGGLPPARENRKRSERPTPTLISRL
jgi:membrane protein YdbS with pleckstrin-like domain